VNDEGKRRIAELTNEGTKVVHENYQADLFFHGRGREAACD